MVLAAAAKAENEKVTKKLTSEVVVSKGKVKGGKGSSLGVKGDTISVAVLQKGKKKAVSFTNAFVSALDSYSQVQLTAQQKSEIAADEAYIQNLENAIKNLPHKTKPTTTTTTHPHTTTVPHHHVHHVHHVHHAATTTTKPKAAANIPATTNPTNATSQHGQPVQHHVQHLRHLRHPGRRIQHPGRSVALRVLATGRSRGTAAEDRTRRRRPCPRRRRRRRPSRPRLSPPASPCRW